MNVADMTLKEIEARDTAIRNRAYKLGKLRDEEDNARRALASIERRLTEPTPLADTLKSIKDLADTLPATLTMRGATFLPGGMELRLVISGECGHALAILEQQRKELQESLPAARQRLAAAEARLNAFTTEKR